MEKARVSPRWRAVDRILTEEMPRANQRVALAAITVRGRVMISGAFRDKEQNRCPLMIMAEAVQGRAIEPNELAIAETLGISVGSVSFVYGTWDELPSGRRRFLKRMSEKLEELRQEDQKFQPQVQLGYPVFRATGYKLAD